MKNTLACVLAISMGLSTTACRQADGADSSALLEKGGEEEFGPYELVADWPQSIAKPGYVMGSIPGVAADSPNRIFVAMRGELKLPDELPRNFDNSWGSLGTRATTAEPEMRNTIFALDANGRLLESWTQWDSLFTGGQGGFGGPHMIRINELDPERHVWVINDLDAQIYKFTNDGKELALTLGERGVAGDDEAHFTRPQGIAWLPDGSILVVDGNSRVVKFDESGRFMKQWGTRGSGPGQLSGAHAIDADRNGRIYVADRGNSRIEVFDEDGTYLDEWPNVRFPDFVLVTPDQSVWVSDGTTGKLLKYDTNGRLLYSWGVNGTYPGAHWEFHAFSVDSGGNLYTADSYAGRVQKFEPKPGADPSRLVAPLSMMTGR